MATCVPTPVSTAFSTVIGNTITTTYSLSTSAVPPVVTTQVGPYCENEAVVLDSSVCLKTGTSTGTEILQRTFQSLVISTLFSSCAARVSIFCVFVVLQSISLNSEELTLFPFSRNLNSFVRNGRIQRSTRVGPCGLTRHPITFRPRSTLLGIQPLQKLYIQSHTKPRSPSPPSFPSAHSTAAAQTPPPTQAEDPTQVPAMVQILTPTTSAQTSTLGMAPTPGQTTEGRFPSRLVKRWSHPPCWFIRLAHRRLPWFPRS